MLSTREMSITHAAHELTATLCFHVKNIYLQNLIEHHYKDRRINILLRFKTLLGTDPTNPVEITTAILKYIVQILFSV